MKEWILLATPIEPSIVASIFFSIPSFQANQRPVIWEFKHSSSTIAHPARAERVAFCLPLPRMKQGLPSVPGLEGRVPNFGPHINPFSDGTLRLHSALFS